MRMPMTRRAVGLKTNKPESVAATRASIAKNQIAERFTLGPSFPPNLLLVRYFAMNPSFGACLNLARSVCAGTHQVFPELGVDRLRHQPAGHGGP